MRSVKFLLYFTFQSAFTHVLRGSCNALNIACFIYIEIFTYQYVFMVDDAFCSFLFVNILNI